MKTTLLIILTIVTITVPCFAQEVEPEGLFGLHGTVWRKIGVWKSNIDNSYEIFGIDRGFYAGQVYELWDQRCLDKGAYQNGSYQDLLIVGSYQYSTMWGDDNNVYGTIYSTIEDGMLFPLIGIGFVEVTETIQECWGIRDCDFGAYDPYYILLRKINNGWNPSTDCPSFDSLLYLSYSRHTFDTFS